MAEIKNWVLVSTQIPTGYEALDASDGIREGPRNRLVADWEYRAYEVPEWGSFDGVEFDENDRFVVLAQGQSLTELPTWPYKRGMIGDIRSSDARILAERFSWNIVLANFDKHDPNPSVTQS